MEQEPQNPRRRGVIIGAAIAASLAIAVPAAVAATGDGGSSTQGGTTTQEQPRQQDTQQGEGEQGAQPRDRGGEDGHGPCPEKDGQGGSSGSGDSPGSSSDTAPQSAEVAYT